MLSEDSAHAHRAETDPTVYLLTDSIFLIAISPASEYDPDIGTWGNFSRRNANLGFKVILRSASIGKMTCPHQLENTQPMHSNIVQNHSSIE